MGFVTEYDKASLSAGFWLSGLESLACSWMMFGVVVLAERERERERDGESGRNCVRGGGSSASTGCRSSLSYRKLYLVATEGSSEEPLPFKQHLRLQA